MDLEIERKFLVKKLPDLSGIIKQEYKRYYLFHGNGIEVRIQRIDGKYELERKVETSQLGRNSQIIKITKEEFEYFKPKDGNAIIRDNYIISENPGISIKIYHGRFEGLQRVEVEFANEREAECFKPFVWMGKEITNSPLGKDSKLLNLSEKEFGDLLFSK